MSNFQYMQQQRIKREHEASRQRAEYLKAHPRPRVVVSQTTPTWRIMRDAIKAEVEHYRANEHLMTPLERREKTAALISKREAQRSLIETGLLLDHATALGNLKATANKVEAARAAITNAWDSQRLAADLQLYSARISAASQVGDLAELQAIRDEARASQDKYKVRAYSIAIQSNAAKLPTGAQDEHGVDGKMIVNRMQLDAAQDLSDLRTSPELELSEAALDEARQAMQAANDEIKVTAVAYGEASPDGWMIHNENYNAALARVRLHPDGSFDISEE